MTLMRYRALLWLSTGILLFSATIGLITGLSSSPVVTTVIPLLFSVFTAGGLLYVLKDSSEGNEDNTLTIKSIFIGVQLSAFAIGTLVGVWGGVAVKYNPQILWQFPPKKEFKPAYAQSDFSDVRALAVAIKLDRSMIASGLAFEERIRAFEMLDVARKQRLRILKESVVEVHDLLNMWKKPSVRNTHDAANILVNMIDDLEVEFEFTDEQEEIVIEARNLLKSVVSEDNFGYVEIIESVLESYQELKENYHEFSLLSYDEADAAKAVLELEEVIVQEKADRPTKLVVDVNRTADGES